MAPDNRAPRRSSHLSDDAQVGPIVQQRRRHVPVSLPGRQVERRVPGAGGGIWACSVGQQLLDNVLFAQAGRDVQWGLVVLATTIKQHTKEVNCKDVVSFSLPKDEEMTSGASKWKQEE